MNNYELLSKTISYALRHAPWEYELELDEEGWVKVEDLLSALQAEHDEWQGLSVNDLSNMISHSSKQRHELKKNKIRALYGHSIPNKLCKQSAEPPEILYHGTSSKLADFICKEGLKPMSRQYIHLSTDIETAMQVGHRKSSHPVLLIINAKEAYHDGASFYIGNEHVWLADNITSKYIRIKKS